MARRAKISASLMMSVCLVIMLLTVKHRWIIVIAGLGMAAGALWMWSRPERVENATLTSPSADDHTS